MNKSKKSKLRCIIDVFETTGICACMIGMFIMTIINVVARTFFQSIPFAEEVNLFFIIFITFTGISYGARKARHIRMGAIVELLPKKVEKVLVYLMCVLSAITMLALAYYSLRYLMQSYDMGNTTPALRIPYWIFIIIVPLGFFSAGIQYILTIVKNIKEKDVWLSPEQMSEYEDEQY